MKIFEPKLFSTVKKYTFSQFASDFVAGIIVAIVALPLSIALAIASGVSPQMGIYTAIVAGLIIAVFGGSRVNISGPTAAFATIVAGIVVQYGIGGLATATVMAGVILILMGIFRFGVLIKYIPATITVGFTAGIAVTIAVGQVKDFLGLTYESGVENIETTDKLANIGRFFTTFNFQALLVGIIGLVILIGMPIIAKKLSFCKFGKIIEKIPPSLIAVIVGVVIVKGFDMKVNTIGDLYTITRDLPKFSLPDFSFDTVKNLIPSAFTIAILAAIESLLSCVVSDGMIGDEHNSNTELIAQGLGNVCSALFGGIPATGAIARTAANVKNGGRSPVSGIIHAIILLLVLVVLMPYASLIPMPIIASILFMVAYNMCGWRKFVLLCKTAPKSDILVLVATFVLTVVFDLVIAIEVGMVLASILFLKRMSDLAKVRLWVDTEEKKIPDHVCVYEIEGPMFFATTKKFMTFPVKDTDKVLIIRMSKVLSLDSSAMAEIESVRDYCKEKNVKLLLSHVNEQPMTVMKKAGFLNTVEEDTFCHDIDTALAYADKIANSADE